MQEGSGTVRADVTWSSTLRFAPGFLDDVEKHLLTMGGDPAAVAA